mmetsp:Transcript_23903/g.39303  ORF Transcript_23903/g.39303 Transcript_23903/m.39303 type:complete len:247 (+) Transcript_23903:448-1188(+)
MSPSTTSWEPNTRPTRKTRLCCLMLLLRSLKERLFRVLAWLSIRTDPPCLICPLSISPTPFLNLEWSLEMSASCHLICPRSHPQPTRTCSQHTIPLLISCPHLPLLSLPVNPNQCPLLLPLSVVPPLLLHLSLHLLPPNPLEDQPLPRLLRCRPAFHLPCPWPPMVVVEDLLRLLLLPPLLPFLLASRLLSLRSSSSALISWPTSARATPIVFEVPRTPSRPRSPRDPLLPRKLPRKTCSRACAQP